MILLDGICNIGELMTRCNYLDSWFDSKSKELDEAESKAKKDLITGDKK